METLPPEDFFMADDFFTSSLGSIYGSGLTSGPNYGIAPFGSESEDVFGLQSPTNLKTDALLALFDSSLASFLDTYPPIDDIYVSDLSDEAGCATNLHMNDGLPDFHFLETSYLGTLPNCPEREDSRHISPVSQVLNFERSNSPDSAYFHGHFMPRMNKAELDYATEELPESAVFDGHALERLPSQDSDCSGTISTSSENDPRKDNHWQDCTGATEKNFTKPMKRRGRKPSNLSPEERRKRRLERGRLAANKCRKKKRQLEGELESKASDLLIERDRMLKINHSLKDEIRELQAEILKHVGSDCGGIPGHLAVSSSPPKALHMGGQSYSRRDNGGATDLERLEEGFGERVGDSPDSDAMHSSHSLMSIVSDAQVMAEIDNVGSRSAEEIVRAVLGGLGRNGR